MNSQLLTIALLFLLTGVAIGQPQESPFQVGAINATETSPGVVDVKLTTTTLTAITPVATVPVPSAPFMLSGEIPLREILESDILRSFMQADINGNGMLDQVLVRQHDNGEVQFDGVMLESMGELNGPQEPYRKNGQMRSYMMSPDGPEFSVLYYTPPSIGLLMTDRIHRPEVLELPNPHLQLLVFEHSDPVEGPRFLPDPPTFQLTVDGKEPSEKHLLYAWEPNFFLQQKLSPRWIRAWWITIPLNPKPSVTEHSFQVKVGPGSSTLGLFAQINYATTAGVRLRTNRSVGVIWAPPKK